MSSKTPVTALQELLQKRRCVPNYQLIHNETGTHDPLFKYEVSVEWADKKFTAVGSGKSKKEAKHDAAQRMLQIIGEEPAKSPEKPSVESPYNELLKDNAVGMLQDLCAERHIGTPDYRLTRDEGLPHEKVFSVTVTVSNLEESAEARTKKQAKQLAAQQMYMRLKKTLPPVFKDITVKQATIDDKCDIVIEKLRDTGALKKIISSSDLGLSVANYYKVFKSESFPVSETLLTLKDKPATFIDEVKNPQRILEDIARELTAEMNVEPLALTHDQYNGRVVNLLTTPPWSFFGMGRTSEEATANACREGLRFLVDMIS